MSDLTQSDTPKLTFTTKVRPVKYGDNKTFFEYQILMLHRGKLAGIENGPRRATLTRSDSLKAARARIRELRHRRLYVIRVTQKHISDGQARDCNTCAIAQALWHNQDRMGLPRQEFCMEVSTYGAFVEPRGIVVSKKYGAAVAALPAKLLPDIAIGSTRGEVYSDSMQEWAMHWDDWAEARHMSLKEWREEHGFHDDERPARPGPCSFVLDLDAFTPEARNA